ncbi:MAG: DUF3105 domain-containing protein [Thermodesulfobacteriota bacterium]
MAHDKKNISISRKERRKVQHQEAKLANKQGKMASRKAARLTRIGIYVGLILVAIFLGFVAYTRINREMPGVAVSIIGNQHLRSLTTPHIPYNSDPPTSGPHVSSVARWGVHTRPIPRELQVHNLEDGGVFIQYSCKDCDELIKKLEEIVLRYPYTILAPYPEMDSKIASTAWGRIDQFSEFDKKRIIRFIEAYKGKDHHVRY